MEHKFKVGDKVQVATFAATRYGGKCGEVFIVLPTGSVAVEFPDELPNLFNPSQLVLVEPGTPRHQFKNGERVRVLSSETISRKPHNLALPSAMLKLCDQILTIEKYDPVDGSCRAAGFWWAADWLEPVAPQSEASRYPIDPLYTVPASEGVAVFPASELPLINTTKLLTNIKLD